VLGDLDASGVAWRSLKDPSLKQLLNKAQSMD
jgi:hypothetical protein